MEKITLKNLFRLINGWLHRIFKKGSNIQNVISQTIEIYNKEFFSTRSRIGQKAIIQSKVFKEAWNILGETISDMDLQLEQKDNKIQFSEDKIEIPDAKVIEELNRLDLNKNFKQWKKWKVYE